MTVAATRDRGVLRSLAVAVCVAGALAAAPAPAAAQSLIEALGSAYRTNPSLLGARAELRSVNEEVPQAVGGWRPSVAVTGSAGYDYTDLTEPPAPRVDQHLYPRQAEIAVTQPLFDAGIAPGIDGAEALVQAQRAELASVEQQILLAAAQAYLNVATSQRVLALRRDLERALSEEIALIERRLGINEATRSDLDQARARLAGAESDTAEALAQANQSLKAFALVTGLEAGSLAMPAALQGLPETRDAAIQRARTANPSVIAAGFRERAAEEDVREALGALFPSLDLKGSVTRAYDTLSEDSDETTAAIGLSVTIPLYQKGIAYSEVRQARQTASQRRLATEQARRNAEQAAEEAWQDTLAARSQRAAFARQAAAAEDALEGLRRAYRLGDATVSDLLDQLRELKGARIGAVEAARDEVIANFRLLQAVGRLNAFELGLPVEIYDPQADYRAVRDAWFGTGAPGTE
jgi:TolC family type I secretion outer membrane protein